MKKQRRPWGLLGLIGLGGLVMMSGSSSNDAGGPDSGGSGSDGPGGDDPNGGSDSGGSGGDDDPADDEPIVVALPDLSDFPPPPDSTPSPGPGPKPTPKPGVGKPVGGAKPPTSTPDDDDDDGDGGDDNGGNADDGPPTGPAVDPSPIGGPPWSELVDPYPRGGRFYPVKANNRFGGTSTKHSIAYRFLLSEAYLAAAEVGGLDHDDALAWALAVAKQDKVRLQVIDLIQCSGWNDAMYGANPVKVSHASQHGRSILLNPVHGPTESLLSNGETPVRNITMTGKPADGDYRERELLWLPAIDRAVLWESGGTTITTTGMLWLDGSTMENPPPWVMALGIHDLSDALSGDFGCPGSDGELEVG